MIVLLTTLMIIFLLLITWFISTSMEKEKQMKNSTFESGFESNNTYPIPFSSQYFLVAMIFLIFDLEITMTIPIPLTMEKLKSLNLISVFLISLSILLLKELKSSSIEWVK